MFVTCGRCGYLTPEGSALCKHCGAVASATNAETPAEAPAAGAVPERPTAPVAGPATPWPPAPAPEPAPTYAPPSTVVPPGPPPGPVASMFPEPGARPARRTPPTWSFVSAAIVVVVVALVVVLATRGGDRNGAARLHAANVEADRTARDVERLDASLLSIADLGTGWTTTQHGGLTADDLRWTDTECDDAIGLRSVAQLGRNVNFSYGLDASGRESGHASMNVRQYATARQAKAQYAARAYPAFASCVGVFNVADLVDEDGGDIQPGPMTRLALPGVDAAIYRQSLDYTFQGVRHTMFVTRGYLADGRYLATLTIQRCCQDYDPVAIEDLVRAMSQRLAAHAPRS